MEETGVLPYQAYQRAVLRGLVQAGAKVEMCVGHGVGWGSRGTEERVKGR